MGIAVSIAVAVASVLLLLFARRRKKLPPGPKGWPVLGSLGALKAMGMPHAALFKLSQKYGPLMHLKLGTTHTFVASSPEMAEEFLKAHDMNFSDRPLDAGATYLSYGQIDLVWAPYGPRWKMLRRICNLHLFSSKALADFQHMRQAELGMLVLSLFESSGSPVNLGNLLNVCTANVLGRVMVGRRVFAGEDGEAGEFRKTVLRMMKLAGEFVIGDFVPSLKWLNPKAVVSEMKQVHRTLDSFFEKLIEGHSQDGDSRKDFLSILLSLRDDRRDLNDEESESLSLTEIKALLLNLFTAGTDTSSSTTEWAMAELLHKPNLLKRCQEEADAVAGRQRLLTENDLKEMVFLRAVIKETLRLHPSTPLLLPRKARESCRIGGYDIPKGARVMINAWGIQRDPRVWENPLQFDPHRFIDKEKNTLIEPKGADFSILAFGGGRRICVGMSLALRMMEFMLANLIHAFNWNLLHNEEIDMEESFGLTLQRAHPLQVVPSPRLPAHLYNYICP